MRWLAVALICMLTACGPDPDPATTATATATYNACAAKYYSEYNARNIDQCIRVCTACERGTVGTCSTSCRLKGAR